MKPGQGMTIGQISDLIAGSIFSAGKRQKEILSERIETALIDMRNEMIEECAKVADRMCKEEEESEDRNEHSNAAAEAHWQCADQIRALSSPSKDKS